MEAAQPFLVRSMADLLRILQEHPEWRAQLQGVLLSQRLLELPDRFDAFVERDYVATQALLEQTARHLEAASARLDRIAEQISELTERLTQLTQRVDDLTQRMERVEAQIEVLAQRVDDLTQRMERVEAQIEALTQRMERVEAQIEVLAQRVDDLTQRMERVEAQIEALTQRMERVEAQIEVLAQRVDDLTQRMERVEVQIEALTQRMERVEAQIEVLAQRVDDLTQRMERVEATLKKHGDELGRIKGIVMELRFEKWAVTLLRRDFRRVRVLSGQEWGDLLDEAEEAAILTPEEIDEVSRLDGVVEAYRRVDRQPVVIAVEVSAVGDRRDVERAARRAALLSRILSWKRQQPCPGVAAVVAESFTAGAIENARSSEALLLSFELD